jgi:DNA-binding transcriptional LysR family regulator
MRLKQIEDFLAVVEAGSIHAAARKIGVSQPAVTKSVRALEAELHVQLMRRTNHGIVPTPAGRAFFARARVAHSELRKAHEELRLLGGDGGGTVAFGVGPTAGTLVVPEAIADFRLHNPRARVRVVEGFPNMLLPLVRDETLDFALGPRFDGKIDPAFAFRPLFRHDFVIVVRKGHPMRNAKSLAELAGAEWISVLQFSLPDGPLAKLFSVAGLETPKQMVQCESYNIVAALLAKSDMLGLLSSRLLTEPSARESLQHIPIVERLPSYTAGMFSRKDSPFTPAAAAMAKAMTVAARRLARAG